MLVLHGLMALHMLEVVEHLEMEWEVQAVLVVLAVAVLEECQELQTQAEEVVVLEAHQVVLELLLFAMQVVQKALVELLLLLVATHTIHLQHQELTQHEHSKK